MATSRSQIAFTKESLAKRRPILGKRQFFYDKQVPGLAVCVLPTGKKVFYLVKRIDGRSSKVRIGPYPVLTIFQARKLATKLNGEVASGGDPQTRKKIRRGRATLGDVFDHYRAAHLEAHSTAASLAEDVRRFDKYFKKWSNRPTDDIQTAEVASLHTRLGRKAKTEANRVLSLLRRTINHGRIQLGVKGDNPCVPVKKFPEQSRDRFLDAVEIKRLFKALAVEPDKHVSDFVMLALFTGARKTNLGNMRWADVDLDRGIWRIEAAQSKNKMAMIVVLPVAAVELLRNRTRRHSKFVFRDENGRLPGIKKKWPRIRERAGLEDCTLHDLRRTHGSWQAATGASLPVIGKSLGHRSQAATAVYARLDIDPVRKSVELATQAMLAAGGDDAE